MNLKAIAAKNMKEFDIPDLNRQIPFVVGYHKIKTDQKLINR